MLRRLALVLALGAPSFQVAAEDLPDDCTFDQVGIAAQLRALAARVAGGTVDAENGVAEWKLPSGDVVSAGQGGCYDLGAVIAIRFAKGKRPSTGVAVKRLLDAVSVYWSEPVSREIASVLASKDFETVLFDGGDIELQATGPASTPGFARFTIHLSRSEVSVSWMSG